MTQRPDHDVAVIGASIAGCTAATLLARAGARVALIERKPDPAAFKRVCGHFIQPSAVHVLGRLGVLGELEDAGAFRGHGRVWTQAGWFGSTPGDESPRSLSVRRSALDPILRARAASTPGVELIQGVALTDLAREAGVSRLRLHGRSVGERELCATLVVGADGRGSDTAELAGLRTRRSENLRFAYWGYFDGPPLRDGVGVQLWLLEPDVAIATPTDSGLVMYVAMPHRSRLEEFRRAPEQALREFMDGLPDAPPIAESRLAGPIVGKLDMTNESRPATGDGLALVGDAALAADPVAAIGCGWALQSGSWLADAVAAPLAGTEPLERGLERYRRRHRRELRGHARLLADFARREALPPVQRMLFKAAVDDQEVARRLGAYAGRLIRPSQLLTPSTLIRAALAGLRKRGGGELQQPHRPALPE
jgi:2-polyprenyl-6-methoxyphenol hydroxylase-like FAD-dependent oxidoreductase